jgi:hypothetical protein
MFVMCMPSTRCFFTMLPQMCKDWFKVTKILYCIVILDLGFCSGQEQGGNVVHISKWHAYKSRCCQAKNLQWGNIYC